MLESRKKHRSYDNMEKLKELFVEWEQRHKDKGYKRFIRDGIVDDLYKYHPWKLWKKVSIWTQAIQNAFTCEKSYSDSEIEMKLHETMKQIAVVNVKKSNGLASSDNDDLWNFVKEDTDLLKLEIEAIDADIIVCGYTFSMLCAVLGDEVYKESTTDTMYAFWKDKLIIDYYHPACHYPNRKYRTNIRTCSVLLLCLLI